jgi:hypothetical protein
MKAGLTGTIQPNFLGQQLDNHQPFLVYYPNTFAKTNRKRATFMETLQLRLSLEGIDTPEDKLRELQSWLQDAGISARLEIEPPAEGEMGGKVTALILAFTLTSEFTHLPPSVEEGLRQIDGWQQQQQVIKPVIESTGHEKFDEEIQEVLKREQWHIEVRKRRPKVLTTKRKPRKA